MPERIYKLQPNRTIQLRGFDDLGASASVHSATANSFKVSGTFRDPADFAVLIIWDADNFYEHPRVKYLPDMDFRGLVLEFDVTYRNLMPLDSPKYPTIDWPYLDVTAADGAAKQIHLFRDCAPQQIGGDYTAAEGFLTIVEDGAQQYDRITLWFQNLAFDYIVPRYALNYQFYAGLTGAVHSITVDGQIYEYTEQPGDSSAAVAAGLIAALAPDGKLAATQGDGTEENGPTHQVNLRALDTGSLVPFVVTSSTDPTPYELVPMSANAVARALASQINAVNWEAAGSQVGLQASVDGAQIRIRARRPGVDGNRVRLYAVSKNDRLRTSAEVVALTGGKSDATWRFRVDFEALGIPEIRMMWFTYAPPVPDAAGFDGVEWEAEYVNWTVTGAETRRALQVAAPGSVRIEESDSACRYTGVWAEEIGFYSMWYARRASQAGDSVTVRYQCAHPHDLWLGTSLYLDRARVSISVDGGAATFFDCYLNNNPAVNTRRRICSGLAPGNHTVTISLTESGKFFYFDFLEAVVAGDVPDPLPTRDYVSPALDYSTDHTYKLPPSRLLWIFDQLGYAGPMNEYLGVFWWNQRRRLGGQKPSATVTFNWVLEEGDQVFLEIGGLRVGKSVYPNENLAVVARHFEFFINSTFVGVWARSAGNALTIESHSARPAYRFELRAWRERQVSGVPAIIDLAVTGNLRDGVEGEWQVDPAVSPILNRGAHDWHSDFFRECASRGRELTVATSMELVFPPPGFAAVYPDGQPVVTDVGFGSLKSTHCNFGTLMTAYHSAVYVELAGMMAAAGLTPNLQFGEFLWWFFTNYTSGGPGGMGYYDAETKADAVAALGRELHVFRTPDDDPAINGGADALFLRNRLRDHVNAIRAAVLSVAPDSKFEILWPYDVNHPTPAGAHNLGGRLNRFVNLPAEWTRKETSGLDRIKMEALDFGVWSRDRRLVEKTIRFPIELGWPLDSIRHLVGIFRGAYTWEKEFWFARSAGIPVVNLWAFDHICLYGLPLPERQYLDRSGSYAR